MGKIVKTKYRIEVKDNRGVTSQYVWRGRISQDKLSDYMDTLNKSFIPGGINFHLSKAVGVCLYHHKAQVINQFTGEVVATWSAPMFQVL
jgi:hypothetical protein